MVHFHRCDRSVPHVREQCYIARAGQATDMSLDDLGHAGGDRRLWPELLFLTGPKMDHGRKPMPARLTAFLMLYLCVVGGQSRADERICLHVPLLHVLAYWPPSMLKHWCAAKTGGRSLKTLCLPAAPTMQCDRHAAEKRDELAAPHGWPPRISLGHQRIARRQTPKYAMACPNDRWAIRLCALV